MTFICFKSAVDHATTDDLLGFSKAVARRKIDQQRMILEVARVADLFKSETEQALAALSLETSGVEGISTRAIRQNFSRTFRNDWRGDSTFKESLEFLYKSMLFSAVQIYIPIRDKMVELLDEDGFSFFKTIDKSELIPLDCIDTIPKFTSFKDDLMPHPLVASTAEN